MDKIPMTAAGYAVLEIELKQRQSVERPRIIEQIMEARTHGDLSENAEYHAAKEQQSLNEGRIAELEDKLARAEVIDVAKLSGDTVKFGATVTLIDEDTEKKAVWQIVGEPEADAKAGRISITSPLARALIGKKKGASVEVVTPGGRQGLRGHQGGVALRRVSAGFSVITDENTIPHLRARDRFFLRHVLFDDAPRRVFGLLLLPSEGQGSTNCSPRSHAGARVSVGTMAASLELRRVSEVLTLRTCGAVVSSVTNA